MSSLLIVSTIVCFSSYFAPICIKYLMTAIYSENKSHQALRSQIKNLEKEMSGISLVNEFARFARLQRKHTKLVDELKQNALEQLSSRNKTQVFLTYGNKLISIIISLMLMYMYGKEPVVILSRNLLWPFQKFLSWPGSHENSISLTSWMIITRMVVDSCKQDHS